MPRMASALTYLRGLRPTGKAGFAFGSYGWHPRVDELTRYLQEMQMPPVSEPISCRYRPDAPLLERCREAGRLLARVAQEKAAPRPRLEGTRLCLC